MMIHNLFLPLPRLAGSLAMLALAPFAGLAQESPSTLQAGSSASSAKVLIESDLYGYWRVDEAYVKGVYETMKRAGEAEPGKGMTRGLGLDFSKELATQAARNVTLYAPGKRTDFLHGREIQTMPIKIKKVEGSVIEFEMLRHTRAVVFVEGRLVEKIEYDHRAEYPPMYMRRLSDTEVVAFKAKIEGAKLPPAADAPADDRIRFLVGVATPAQAEEMLRTQKDLPTLKTAKGATALSLLMPSLVPAHLALAEKLLAAGADPSTGVSSYGMPLMDSLFIADASRNKDFIKLLVKHGAKIDVGDAQNESPLIRYCGNSKDTEFLKWLLDQGADVNRRSSMNQTLLRNANKEGWAEGAALLIDRGADIKDESGLIYLGVKCRHLPLLKKLAEKGLTDESKNTALIYALDKLERIRLGTDIPYGGNATEERTALLAFLPALIKHDKSRLEAKDSEGNTALAHARDVEVAKMLLDAGASLKCGERITPLHVAAATSPELVRFYLDKGCDPNWKGNGGESALEWAKKHPPKDPVIIDLLSFAKPKA